MVIVKLVFMTTNSIIQNFGQCARIGVRFGPLFSSNVLHHSDDYGHEGSEGTSPLESMASLDLLNLSFNPLIV